MFEKIRVIGFPDFVKGKFFGGSIGVHPGKQHATKIY